MDFWRWPRYLRFPIISLAKFPPCVITKTSDFKQTKKSRAAKLVTCFLNPSNSNLVASSSFVTCSRSLMKLLIVTAMSYGVWSTILLLGLTEISQFLVSLDDNGNISYFHMWVKQKGNRTRNWTYKIGEHVPKRCHTVLSTIDLPRSHIYLCFFRIAHSTKHHCYLPRFERAASFFSLLKSQCPEMGTILQYKAQERYYILTGFKFWHKNLNLEITIPWSVGAIL